jgi:hypothetical protein
VAISEGRSLDLLSLAREICRRYQIEYPDELERYGDAGNAWCVHDNQYLLHWGAEAVNGFVDLQKEVAWLAQVLESRNFPLIRLARNLDLAAEVVRERVDGPAGDRLAAELLNAAHFVRSHGTFLD